ncbi:MAG: iron ABC transporter permease [Phycisphaerae bacterium]|jgi:iron complex transport system permease protein
MDTNAPGHEPTAVVNFRSLAVDLGILAALAAGVAIGCSFIGIARFGWTVWAMRLVRLATAATVGAALATAGMALQAMLRNPLAEPYILGVSTGAGVGVLVGGVLAGAIGLAGWASEPILALVGALATCLVVYGIAQRHGHLDPYVLLLSGVIVNVFNGALMLAILLVANPNDILNFVGWGMGQIRDTTDVSLLVVCAAAAVAGWGVLLVRGAAFNALGLGDDVAASIGVHVRRLRVETFAVAAVMTAAAVALAGPIGFVGLIVPHACRLLVGPDHRRLAVWCGLVGAIFLMLADTLCRTAGEWVAVGSVPVGVITALAGGPFFIFLLRRRSREAPL